MKEFSSLMLDIRNRFEEDKLFNFISGLQGWAQTKLRRQGVRDLPIAMVTTDFLLDGQCHRHHAENQTGWWEKVQG